MVTMLFMCKAFSTSHRKILNVQGIAASGCSEKNLHRSFCGFVYALLRNAPSKQIANLDLTKTATLDPLNAWK